MNRNELTENILNLHSTSLGIERIKRNLKLDEENVVEYCKKMIFR